MARPLRIECEGAGCHVTSLSNARANIYMTNSDRLMFLEVLADVIARLGWICHAYCGIG